MGRLDDAQMASVGGGSVTWTTFACLAAGGAVTAGSGQPWLGILATLECNDLLAPEPLG